MFTRRRKDGHVEAAAADLGIRAALRAAVRAMDDARASRGDLEDWTPMTEARWTLVDQFDTNGQRYVVARRSEFDLPALDALSVREHQVLGFAALGHANKLIAYELGITPSTVGVLLSRARQKLGATSREELIDMYRREVRDVEKDGLDLDLR
jgi:DNA-binding CsgD family transcriptional regulator